MTEPTKYSSAELSGSLTGFEEVGIVTAFGSTIRGLQDNMPARALVFVTFKRDGMTHDEAYQAAMSLRADEVADRFSDDDDEPFPDEPVTESGKDDSSPASEQKS